MLLVALGVLLLTPAMAQTEQDEIGSADSEDGRAPILRMLAATIVFLGFFFRSLPVGAAIALSTQIRPERWSVVWVLGGLISTTPLAARNRSGEEAIGVFLGKLIAAAGLLVAFFFPGVLPGFLVWLAKLMVM